MGVSTQRWCSGRSSGIYDGRWRKAAPAGSRLLVQQGICENQELLVHGAAKAVVM